MSASENKILTLFCVVQKKKSEGCNKDEDSAPCEQINNAETQDINFEGGHYTECIVATAAAKYLTTAIRSTKLC